MTARAAGSPGAGVPGDDPWAPPPEDEAVAVPDADVEQVARTILLDQLTGRARSRQELATKLASRDVPEEVSLVDDAAFARTWVEGRRSAKGLARRALAQELRRKGVDDEVAREALAEVEPDDETETARVLVRKKLRSMSGLETPVATRRLVGMLARKGYAPGTAYSVVREELAARGDEVDELDGAGETD
jgi:regulatory protein